MSSQGAGNVRPAVWLDAAAVPVLDASKFPASALFGVDDDMLVSQHADAQTPKLGQPLAQPRVVFMVARDPEDAQACPQTSQGERIFAVRPGSAIDQVSCDNDEVWGKGIGAADDVVGEAATLGRSDVQVSQLDDCGSRQAGGSPGSAMRSSFTTGSRNPWKTE